MSDIPLLPSDQLKSLAFDYSCDQVFFAFKPDEIQECFGEALRQHPFEGDQSTVGFVWARVADAVATLDNGKPVFLTYRLLHKENLQEFSTYVDEYESIADALREMPPDIRAETMQRMIDDSKDITSLAERVDEE